MSENTQLQTANTQLSPVEIKSQLSAIKNLLRDVMEEDLHFGTIPGTKKPSLYKAGAELINFMFRLSPEYNLIEKTELPNNHLMYEVHCLLRHIPTGQIWGRGVGSCSTMESKYRYRTGEVTFTGKPVPQEYWVGRDVKLIGGKGYATKKNPDTGKWEIVEMGEKVENENPADEYNTVLKMAKKRAYNDATLTASAASTMFTQDLEHDDTVNESNLDPKNEVKMPQKKNEKPDLDSKRFNDAIKRAAKGPDDQLITKLKEHYIVSPDQEEKILAAFPVLEVDETTNAIEPEPEPDYISLDIQTQLLELCRKNEKDMSEVLINFGYENLSDVEQRDLDSIVTFIKKKAS